MDSHIEYLAIWYILRFDMKTLPSLLLAPCERYLLATDSSPIIVELWYFLVLSR